MSRAPPGWRYGQGGKSAATKGYRDRTRAAAEDAYAGASVGQLALPASPRGALVVQQPSRPAGGKGVGLPAVEADHPIFIEQQALDEEGFSVGFQDLKGHGGRLSPWLVFIAESQPVGHHRTILEAMSLQLMPAAGHGDFPSQTGAWIIL